MEIAVFPNPFQSALQIHFNLPGPSVVELSVYAITGQKVATLVQDTRSGGAQRLVWNGTDQRGRRLSPARIAARGCSGTRAGGAGAGNRAA